MIRVANFIEKGVQKIGFGFMKQIARKKQVKTEDIIIGCEENDVKLQAPNLSGLTINTQTAN